MIELKTNQKVPLEIGGNCTVKKELGRGGQGIVYLVDLNGKDMALKWYTSIPEDSFYKNLKNNVSSQAPSDAFIWPLYLTKIVDGQFGYIMKLRPQGYFEFCDFLLAKQKFTSFYAMLNAAMKICDGFKNLHRLGFSYQDLNDGNFFIRPQDGDVLICDNDNVSPYGKNSGIKGKMRYMAPEVVIGGNPDTYSDRFSLSVILFLLFFVNHPLEGAKVAGHPCLTEQLEKQFYGTEPEYIFSPEGGNRPVKNIHTNVLKRWKLFPELLRKTFSEQFSRDKIQNPQSRILESEWQKILADLRDETAVCPNCKRDTFIDVATQNCCVNCGHKVDISRQIKLGKRNIYLVPKSRIFLDYDNSADGYVDIYAKDPNIYTLTNIGTEEWVVEATNGDVRKLSPKETMPVKAGLKISFGSKCDTDKGEITIS